MGDTVTAATSFDGWYRQEHPRVLALVAVASGDAEMAAEITAEAFTRALERWDRVAAMDSPAAWTYRVAVNLLRRRLRRAAVEQRLWARATEPARPAAIEPDLWAAVRALPARQRTAIALRYICDLPQAEIALVMDVATGTVSATLTAARRRLATVLGETEQLEVAP